MVLPVGRRAIALASAADHRRGRAGATLIEASITARLLGMRLLTLDAKVALVPADVTVAAPRPPQRAVPAPALASGSSPGRAGAAGHHGLADAVRNLNEGAKLLAEVQRRDGSSAGRR
ncbi:MAG: hypothetical protein ABW167_06865 [Baekduia sp.]